MLNNGYAKTLYSRTPRGVRELKHVHIAFFLFKFSRTPRGVRELKPD